MLNYCLAIPEIEPFSLGSVNNTLKKELDIFLNQFLYNGVSLFHMTLL